jgi:hypothetical protein
MEVSSKLTTPVVLHTTPIQFGAGQARKPVWMFWRKEKSLAPAGN